MSVQLLLLRKINLLILGLLQNHKSEKLNSFGVQGFAVSPLQCPGRDVSSSWHQQNFPPCPPESLSLHLSKETTSPTWKNKLWKK